MSERRDIRDGTIRTLQCVYSWLATTENWIARMLANLPECDVRVLAGELRSGSYHDPRFTHVRRPFQRIDNPDRRPIPRAWNAAAKVLEPLGEIALGISLRGRIDVVHSHFSFVGWECMRLARAARVPHLVSFYGFDYENLPFVEPIWNARYGRLFSSADRFICEGRHGASILRGMGCPEERIRVVRLGVEPSAIPFPEKAPSRHGGFAIVQLATLNEKKGHADAIRAFARARSRLPQGSTFTIAGRDGDVLRGELAALAVREGVSDSVRFVDGIDFARMHEFLAGFHAFLHPSRYTASRDCEGGAPVVLLDAQAVGLPVVATRHCDIPDEVVDGRTGFLADEGDVDALADALSRLSSLGDGEYEAMRRAGREHVESAFDVRRNAGTLRDVYAECVEENMRRG